MLRLSGESGVPGAPGIPYAGGRLLRDLFPNAPTDAPQLQNKFGKPRIPLKELFPARPGGMGIPPGMPGYDYDRLLQMRPGDLTGNPFGSDFVIPSQRQAPIPGGPQLNPLRQAPARVFPQDQPGREGAISVEALQALMKNMPSVGNSGFYSGQQLAGGFHNKTIS
jgi:hypothetical protein